jgi:hypothetical protein
MMMSSVTVPVSGAMLDSRTNAIERRELLRLISRCLGQDQLRLGVRRDRHRRGGRRVLELAPVRRRAVLPSTFSLHRAPWDRAARSPSGSWYGRLHEMNRFVTVMLKMRFSRPAFAM